MFMKINLNNRNIYAIKKFIKSIRSDYEMTYDTKYCIDILENYKKLLKDENKEILNILRKEN